MSEKRIMILEVSQKQAYIFSSRKLRDNCVRSQQIADVTDVKFFKQVWPEFAKDCFVYSGGGHSILQFADRETADAFARAVSFAVLQKYPGMELYLTHISYKEKLSPPENLLELSKALEEKKARRWQSFRRIIPGSSVDADRDYPSAPNGWSWTNDVNKIAGKDNFLAVVHLDGNSMGKRVQGIYEKSGSDWDRCAALLRQFSEEINQHFSEAFDEMIQELTASLERQNWESRIIPVRKLIGAGDDVCFLTQGALGLECAASFLEHLRKKQNHADGQYYSACAGVVMIHTTAPFRQAYDLSESLCRSAKTFVAQHGGDFDALNYHLEFGQIKDDLSEINGNLKAEDGTVMTTRPLALSRPALPHSVCKERTYAHFRDLVKGLQKDMEKLPRSKMKTLRVAFQQGEIETKLALRMFDIESVLKQTGMTQAYFNDGDKRCCVYYDPIEMMDHVKMWRCADHE